MRATIILDARKKVLIVDIYLQLDDNNRNVHSCLLASPILLPSRGRARYLVQIKLVFNTPLACSIRRIDFLSGMVTNWRKEMENYQTRFSLSLARSLIWQWTIFKCQWTLNRCKKPWLEYLLYTQLNLSSLTEFPSVIILSLSFFLSFFAILLDHQLPLKINYYKSVCLSRVVVCSWRQLQGNASEIITNVMQSHRRGCNW